MLNGFKAHLALELAGFFQQFHAQGAQSAIFRNIAKFLEVHKALDFQKIPKKSGICAQIRLILKEFHNNDTPGAQGHKGQNPENYHGNNIRLGYHL